MIGLDLVNINAYQNLVKFCQNFLKILNSNEILTPMKGHNSVTNLRKKKCKNPNLDLGHMNAYIRFCVNLLICSQEIERKRNFGVNFQGP